MRDIHCPKDIGFENTFSGEDCEKEQFYNNCYHCWSTALAKEKAQSNKNFYIKLTDNLTNGDMIKAMFNPYKICEYKYSIHVYMTEEDFLKADYQINYNANWWNAPYIKSET